VVMSTTLLPVRTQLATGVYVLHVLQAKQLQSLITCGASGWLAWWPSRARP
jgi:hypothetical protein